MSELRTDQNFSKVQCNGKGIARHVCQCDTLQLQLSHQGVLLMVVVVVGVDVQQDLSHFLPCYLLLIAEQDNWK